MIVSPDRPRPGSRSTSAQPHRPAVPAVAALAWGILLDSLVPVSMSIWLVAAATAILGSLFLNHWCQSFIRINTSANNRKRLERAASLFSLLAFMTVGGAWHHFHGQLRLLNDVSTFSSSTSSPVRLCGVIASPVEIVESAYGPHIPSWMEVDQSRCRLLCRNIETSSGWISASGTIQLQVDGHLTHANVGELVEVLGHIVQPAPNSNPGGFDFAHYLRQQGISALVRVEHPVAVKPLGQLNTPRWILARLRNSLRRDCLNLLDSHLSEDERAVASSMLIGDRTMLTQEQRDQFARSGAVHLLAISGLHVAILLGLMLSICRLLNLSPRVCAILLLLTVFGYAFVTDHRPPVLRAGILASLAVCGIASGKRVDAVNLLAVCALVLLLWHPADLFDIGAQLSFLAVGAILWSSRWTGLLAPLRDSSLDAEQESSPWHTRLRMLGASIVQVELVTAAIWLFTLPLTMATFHLVAPVGILLNVVLIPYIGIVLALGYLFLIGGLLLPVSASLLALPFQISLWLLLKIVDWGNATPLGHFTVPNIPQWWLIGFYVLLALVCGIAGGRFMMRWSGRGILVWFLLGLVLPFVPAHRNGLRCTFLSVGHGLATVIELPAGQTILYDVGTIGDGQRAQRAACQYLWSRGIRRIDAAIISHADHDHYSGFFGLLDQVPVDLLLIHRSFLDFQQTGIQELCDQAAGQNISIRLLQAGDELKLPNQSETGLRIRVVAPPSQFTSRSDNAASLVIAIEYAGRRVLLTGDLEKEGLDEVLSLPASQFDVLLSPHHGGRVDRVFELYEWAQPRYAIVSSSSETLPHLSKISANCQLLNTATSGAITVTISPQGEITVDEFLKP